MKKAWLIYNAFEANRNSQNIAFYFRACKKLNITISLLIYENIRIKNNSIEYFEKVLDKPDFAIVRVIAPDLNKALENQGIKAYNNSFVSEICNDKWKTYLEMKKIDVPVMNTILLPNEILSYPFVMKSVDGKGGKEVFLIEDENEYIDKKQILDGRKVIIQEVANDLGKDLRVYVIGKKIICSILRISTTSFKSNFSLGGKPSLYKLNKEEKNLVNKIIEHFDFSFVGIDFVFSDGKMILNEIEDVVGSRMVYELTKIDITKKYIKYILKEEKKWKH